MVFRAVINFVLEILADKHGDVKDFLSGEAYLVLGYVIDGALEIFADGNVELEAAESPRDEDDIAALLVEWKVFDVERAVGLYQSRVHPQYNSV